MTFCGRVGFPILLASLWCCAPRCAVAADPWNGRTGCFSVVVGKNASADGSVMFAHNEDAVAPAVNGKHWVAQRVPDDKVAPIPNCYTIQGIDLRDTVNFLGSPDIIEYAITRGWYDPARSLD